MSKAYTLTCLGFAVLLGFAGLGCVIASVPIIIASQPDLELAYIMDDPERDFEYLGAKACNVTRVKRCWETTTGDYPPNTAVVDRVDGEKFCWEVHIAQCASAGLNPSLRCLTLPALLHMPLANP